MSFVGDIVGSMIGADASRSASNTQADTTREGIGEQRRQFDLTREDYAPWREAGKNALATIMSDINNPVTASDVMQDPGYQFGLTQGQNALDRKFAAAGGRVSGAAMKSASRYGTDYASTGYNAAYQRRQDSLNRLASVAGLGQTATAGSAAAGAGAANAISAMTTAQGNAAGAARLAQGSIWSNAASKLGSYYGSGTGSGAWDFGGFAGTNDRSGLSTGNSTDWWSTYGSGGD